MLYLMIIILAVIIGLLRGGELEKISHISIEGVYFFVAALLLRGLVWIFGILDFSILLRYSSFFIIFSYFLLIFASIRNIKLPGFRCVTLGVLLNSFVILVNGGKMPVLINQQIAQNMGTAALPGQEQNLVHTLMGNETLFAFLGDVIPLPGPFPDNSILSVGDIMIFIGLFIFIQNTMMKEDMLKQDNEEIVNEIEEGISL